MDVSLFVVVGATSSVDLPFPAFVGSLKLMTEIDVSGASGLREMQ